MPEQLICHGVQVGNMEDYEAEIELAHEKAREHGHWLKSPNGDRFHVPDGGPEEPSSVCRLESYTDFHDKPVETVPDDWLEGNICLGCLDQLSEVTPGPSNSEKYAKSPEDVLEGILDGE